jgi:hypothetical protein
METSTLMKHESFEPQNAEEQVRMFRIIATRLIETDERFKDSKIFIEKVNDENYVFGFTVKNDNILDLVLNDFFDEMFEEKGPFHDAEFIFSGDLDAAPDYIEKKNSYSFAMRTLW